MLVRIQNYSILFILLHFYMYYMCDLCWSNKKRENYSKLVQVPDV